MTYRSLPLFLVLLSFSFVAAAQEGTPARVPYDDRPINIGLASGWGAPLGNAQSGVPLSDVLVGQVPVALDASFRALPHVFVGAYSSWGFGALEGCASGATCRVKDVRFGLGGRYVFGTRSGVVPWVGLGAGFETLTAKTRGSISLKRNYQGITFVDGQLGLDIPVHRALALGPTMSLSVGEFSRATVERADSGDDIEGEIEDPRLHGWATFGLRVVLAPTVSSAGT